MEKMRIVNDDQLSRWGALYGRLNRHVQNPRDFDYRHYLTEDDIPDLSTLHTDDLAEAVQGFVPEQFAQAIRVFKDNERNRVIVQPQYDKEQGNRAYAKRLEIDPDEALFLHFGDFFPDVPAGISKPDSYYFACSTTELTQVVQHGDITSDYSAPLFVPAVLTELATSVS